MNVNNNDDEEHDDKMRQKGGCEVLVRVEGRERESFGMSRGHAQYEGKSLGRWERRGKHSRR